jgi:hypothetical protein
LICTFEENCNSQEYVPLRMHYKGNSLNDGWNICNRPPSLYKRYKSEIDPTFLNVDNMTKVTYELVEINRHSSDSECLLAQHMLLWNTDKYLKIFPAHLLMEFDKQNMAKT